MISDILERLSKKPDAIIELLNEYGYEKFKQNSKEIRFARGFNSGLNITIRLNDNPGCIVKDFVTNDCNNIINFIMAQRGVNFREVLQSVKKILGLNDYFETPKRELFNGIYANIGVSKVLKPKIYPEETLQEYDHYGNIRFLLDHISLESQKKFEIMYNNETQRIVIPIRDIYGNLCGTKCRRNYDTDNPDDPKYIFELPCQKNLILYGAHQNFQHLNNADRIFIFEAEKSTMAADSYGYHNAVSIMGNTLSSEQAKILLSLNAKEYCFLLDEGLPLDITFQNAKILKEYAAMKEIKITYFDWTQSLSLDEKESPTDEGKETFEEIINNEIVKY